MNKISLNLITIREKIKESRIEDILTDNIKKADLSDNLYDFRNENLDILISTITESSERCLCYIDNFLAPKGIKNIIENYFLNDAFGSIFEVKYRLVSEFKCSEEYLSTPDRYKLET